jgi:hypothetical protein
MLGIELNRLPQLLKCILHLFILKELNPHPEVFFRPLGFVAAPTSAARQQQETGQQRQSGPSKGISALLHLFLLLLSFFFFFELGSLMRQR